MVTASHLRLQIELNEKSFERVLVKMASHDIEGKPRNMLVKEFFVKLI